MARRMFALLGEDGTPLEFASPAEGRDGDLYTRRLEADPAHVEVDPETREPLKPPAKTARAAQSKTTESETKA